MPIPFVGPALAFLGAIPPKVWLGLGAVLAVGAVVWKIDDNGYDRAKAEAAKEKAELNAGWKKRWDEREEAWVNAAKAEKARLDALLEIARADAAKRQAELEKKIAELEAARKKADNELKSRRPNYVTPEAVARCGDLSYGTILYRNRAAAVANGDLGAATLPDPPPEIANAASGVRIDTFTDAYKDDLQLLGECRDQVKAHELHLDSVEAFYEKLKSNLKGK